MNTQIKKSRLGRTIGTILVLLGGLLIASNIGLIPEGFHKIIVSWQMLLIIIGIISIIKQQTFHFHGLSMLCLGIFFIIPRVAQVFPSVFSGIYAATFVSVYWPVLLIACGIILIIHIPVPHQKRSRYQHCYGAHRRYGHYPPNFGGKQTHYHEEENFNQEEDFFKTCVFGSGRYIIADTEFKGGTMQAVFGGIELDLRKASLPEGETILNIEAIFGGVELFVPDNWFLEVKIESVLGGMDDSRRTVETVDYTRKLIIKGSAVCGGVEIRN